MVLRTRKIIKKKRGLGLSTRKKICRLCANKVKTVDYKDVRLLESFIKERGKMVSSRISGNCAKHQRLLCKAIKQARYISLIPFTRA
jgi:small subunit ribosomal protein S18